MKRRRWHAERIAPGVRVLYEMQHVLAREKTAHQELLLLENRCFGRVLLLDGVTQVTTADEFMYHEMLSHVPLLAHGQVRDVLIVGGGDGGLAEEVLKHAGVRSVTQVEIDTAVVEFARRHLGKINAGAFTDSRFQLQSGDAAAFVRTTEQRFDAVLVDSTDPVGPAKSLFMPAFYDAVRRCLQPDGVLVIQAGVPFLQPHGFASAMRNLARAFPVVSCYLVASPSYFGGHLALGWASSAISPQAVSLRSLTQRLAAAKLNARYYTPEVHKAAFALPAYIGGMLQLPEEK